LLEFQVLEVDNPSQFPDYRKMNMGLKTKILQTPAAFKVAGLGLLLLLFNQEPRWCGHPSG
jgi:hypothetical protein